MCGNHQQKFKQRVVNNKCSFVFLKVLGCFEFEGNTVLFCKTILIKMLLHFLFHYIQSIIIVCWFQCKELMTHDQKEVHQLLSSDLVSYLLFSPSKGKSYHFVVLGTSSFEALQSQFKPEKNGSRQSCLSLEFAGRNVVITTGSVDNASIFCYARSCVFVVSFLQFSLNDNPEAVKTSL